MEHGRGAAIGIAERDELLLRGGELDGTSSSELEISIMSVI